MVASESKLAVTHFALVAVYKAIISGGVFEMALRLSTRPLNECKYRPMPLAGAIKPLFGRDTNQSLAVIHCCRNTCTTHQLLACWPDPLVSLTTDKKLKEAFDLELFMKALYLEGITLIREAARESMIRNDQTKSERQK